MILELSCKDHARACPLGFRLGSLMPLSLQLFLHLRWLGHYFVLETATYADLVGVDGLYLDQAFDSLPWLIIIEPVCLVWHLQVLGAGHAQFWGVLMKAADCCVDSSQF